MGLSKSFLLEKVIELELENLSSSGFIYVNMIVDTEAILKSGLRPSPDANNPTMVNDNKLFYFVATRGSEVTGSGTGNLKIRATVGDGVRWAGVSESNNFENSVMVYDIAHISGASVLSKASFLSFTKASAVPRSAQEPFPAVQKDQSFWFMTSSVVDKGAENYTVHFAIYNRPQNEEQKLVGYFKWDPAIEVNF